MYETFRALGAQHEAELVDLARRANGSARRERRPLRAARVRASTPDWLCRLGVRVLRAVHERA